MEKATHNLKALMVDDHRLFRKGVETAMRNHLKVDFEEFDDGESLLNRLDGVSKNNDHIDFIITDINHPNTNGLEVIQRIKNYSDTILYHNGLRLKHIPIIILSMTQGNPDIVQKLNRITKDITFLSKTAGVDEILKSIVKNIATYRKDIIQEFTNEGFSIQFEAGKYNISRSYDLPPFIQTKYFEGIAPAASKAATRKILIQNTSAIGKVSINLLEQLLNNTKTTEKDLHEFFLLFPEFLLDNSYDVLYSENFFNNQSTKLRTDIVAQRRGLENVAEEWRIIELKKHTERILTDKKYHSNFCKSVYNAITQLKNYSDYFSDPKNAEEIKKKYNGIIPNPKLSLVIGKTPEGKANLFTKMKRQYPDISITTYDEILTFRKIQVQYMESMGL